MPVRIVRYGMSSAHGCGVQVCNWRVKGHSAVIKAMASASRVQILYQLWVPFVHCLVSLCLFSYLENGDMIHHYLQGLSQLWGLNEPIHTVIPTVVPGMWKAREWLAVFSMKWSQGRLLLTECGSLKRWLLLKSSWWCYTRVQTQLVKASALQEKWVIRRKGRESNLLVLKYWQWIQINNYWPKQLYPWMHGLHMAPGPPSCPLPVRTAHLDFIYCCFNKVLRGNKVSWLQV